MKRIFNFLAIIIALGCISACSSKSYKEKIVGKWICDSLTIVKDSGVFEKLCEYNLRKLDEELIELKNIVDTCKIDSIADFYRSLIEEAELGRSQFTPQNLEIYMKEQLGQSAGAYFIFSADGNIESGVGNEQMAAGTWRMDGENAIIINDGDGDLKMEIISLSDKMVLQILNPVEDQFDIKANFNFSRQ